MDKRKNNKGTKGNKGGRPSKADEIKLIETMDAVSAPVIVWEKLYNKVIEEDVGAIKTWLSYRYGMPKQMLDLTTKGDKLQTPILLNDPLDGSIDNGTTED